MSRAQEIRFKALNYSEVTDLQLAPIDLAEEAFVAGAEWADAHPDIDVRTMAAWQSGYNEGISKSRWISVEDELPPMRDEDGLSDIVLTHSKGGGIYHNRYNYGHNTWDNPYVYNVTHWMPLPEAPVVTDLNKKDLPPVSCQEGDILVTEEGGEE